MVTFYSGFSGVLVGAFSPYSIAVLASVAVVTVVLATFHLKRFLLLPAPFARARVVRLEKRRTGIRAP